MRLRLDGRTQNAFKDAKLLVMVGRRRVWLSTRLYGLVAKLHAARGQYVPTWELADSPDDSVHQLIYRLRKALAKSTPAKIRNIPGKGYRIEC